MDIENSFENAFDTLIGFLPNLLAFLVLLLVGFIVAKVVAAVVRKGLEAVGIDRHLSSSDASQYVERVLPGASAARAIARIVFWLVFLFFFVAAMSALKIPAVSSFMDAVLNYLPNVIVAILIFVVAAVLAGAIAAGTSRVMGSSPTGRIVATVAPAIVMVIAMFMILEQLQIAPEIVRIAFAATMGALALGLALAFGLGGRPVAERMLEDAYRRTREERERARQDEQTGVATGQERGYYSSTSAAASSHRA